MQILGPMTGFTMAARAWDSGVSSAGLHAQVCYPTDYPYLDGKSVSPNTCSAYPYRPVVIEDRASFKQAADKQHVPSILLYAQMCYSGVFGEADKGEARHYFKQAADLGDIDATKQYALMCYNGEGGKIHLGDARYYYIKAAKKQDVFSAEVTAAMCYKGLGGNKNLKVARRFFKQAADQGAAYSQYHYAVMCAQGEGGEVNNLEARLYYKLAADQDVADAQRGYANMCVKGIGGEVDDREARDYYKLAADQGVVESQKNYAHMCYKGMGGEKNDREAREYYKLAADQGFVESQGNYAHMCYMGAGGARDYKEARKYFKLVADQGQARECILYAYMCYQGLGGDRDLKDARQYYKLAADQGELDELDALAYQKEYVLMCMKGQGGDHDLYEARKYIGLIANTGDAEFEMMYAFMLANGLGGDQDLEAANSLLESASNKVHVGAIQSYERVFADSLIQSGLAGYESDIIYLSPDYSDDEYADWAVVATVLTATSVAAAVIVGCMCCREDAPAAVQPLESPKQQPDVAEPVASSQPSRTVKTRPSQRPIQAPVHDDFAASQRMAALVSSADVKKSDAAAEAELKRSNDARRTYKINQNNAYSVQMATVFRHHLHNLVPHSLDPGMLSTVQTVAKTLVDKVCGRIVDPTVLSALGLTDLKWDYDSNTLSFMLDKTREINFQLYDEGRVACISTVPESSASVDATGEAERRVVRRPKVLPSVPLKADVGKKNVEGQSTAGGGGWGSAAVGTDLLSPEYEVPDSPLVPDVPFDKRIAILQESFSEGIESGGIDEPIELLEVVLSSISFCRQDLNAVNLGHLHALLSATQTVCEGIDNSRSVCILADKMLTDIMDHEVERPGDAGASAVALWDQAHFQAFSDLAQLTEPLFKFYINSRLRDIGVVAPAAVVTAAAVDNAVAQPVADASEASPWIGFNVSTQTVETLTRALDKVFPESDALRPHRRGLVCRLAMKLCRSYSWNVGSLRINGASIENVGHVSVGKRGTQKTLSVFFMPQDAEGNAFQLMCTATHKDSGSYKIQTSGSAKFPKGNTIDLV